MKFNTTINYAVIYLAAISIATFVYPIFFTDLNFVGHRYDLGEFSQVAYLTGGAFFHVADVVLPMLLPPNVMLRSTIVSFTSMSVGVIGIASILGLVRKQRWAQRTAVVLMSMQFIFNMLVFVFAKNPSYLLFSIPPGVLIYYLSKQSVSRQFKGMTGFTLEKTGLLLVCILGFNVLVLMAVFVFYNYVVDVQVLYGDMSPHTMEKVIDMDSIHKSRLVQNILVSVTNPDATHCQITDEGYHKCESTQLLKVYQIDQVTRDLQMQNAFNSNRWGFYTGTQYHVIFQQNGIYYLIFVMTPDFWNWVIFDLLVSMMGTLMIVAWKRMVLK
ncbi:MAG: hypothetical protein PXX83_09350 [Candidatus Nitrosotalea sp.]|nr:hypothetical protein [Candidatus Nitrosotalea sp.]